MVEQGALDGVFHALADPTRRALIKRLAGGPRTVGDLAKPFPMSLAAVSKHLGVLRGCGLIEKRRSGRQVRCHLRPERLRLAADWVRDYELFWSSRLEALERVVDEERLRIEAAEQEREADRGTTETDNGDPS